MSRVHHLQLWIVLWCIECDGGVFGRSYAVAFRCCMQLLAVPHNVACMCTKEMTKDELKLQ